MDIDDVLVLMSLASQEMAEIIGRLEVRAHHATGGELRSIQMRLPTLRTDQRALEADIAALSDDDNTPTLPSQEVLDALSAATSDLSDRVAKAQTTEALLGLASAISQVQGSWTGKPKTNPLA